jgi:hypothetical protein
MGVMAAVVLVGCAGVHADAHSSSRSSAATTTVPAAPLTAPTTTSTVATGPAPSDGCLPGSIDTAPPVVPSTTGPAPNTWAAQVIAPGSCPQVVDVTAAGAAFSLLSQSPGGQGPWVLERTGIDSATTETGPTFSVGVLALASGSLWISCGRASSTATGPLLCQVDPTTLTIVRQIQLPSSKHPEPGGFGVAVTEGPADTVWVGYKQILVHVNALDGAILSSEPIASGSIDSLSLDPDHRVLYASLAYPLVSGDTVDAAVVEFDATTGRSLAETSADSPVTGSVAGGALTAVPGGVWMSFRTGMAGSTILLRQPDLAMVGPPSSALNAGFADGVFVWMMSASTVYGLGTLFLANENGVLACIDPQTGTVRAQERFTLAEGPDPQLLAVDAATRQVIATDGSTLEAVSPPAPCWV